MEPIYISPPRTIMEVYKMLPEGTLAELIDGNIYMSPSPLSRHQIVLNKLNVQLYSLLEDGRVGNVYISPLDVYLDEERNAVQPDLIVVLKGGNAVVKEEGHIHGVPDLLVEVLSKGNNKHDLILKKELYERFGVKEYWIVDPDTKLAMVFVLESGKYQVVGEKIGRIESPMLKNAFIF